jgi:hypothetical protein
MLTRLSFILGSLLVVLLSFGLPAPAQSATPGWNTAWRNADGSLKDVVELGGGYDVTAGATRKYQGPGWHYRVGAGYRLNKRFAALVEYNYDHFSIPQPLVDSFFACAGCNVGTDHLWSLTLEPTIDYFSTEHVGGYLIGGGGFYRKVTVFRPRGAEYPCPIGAVSCTYAPGDTTDHFSNNSGGANLGAGFAWRAWDSTNTKLFIEGRYVWVDNTVSSQNTVHSLATERTGYFPITTGVRW